MPDERLYNVLNDEGRETTIAKRDLKKHFRRKSEFDLRQEAARIHMSGEHLIEYQIAALAQMELDRRAAARQRNVTIIVTVLSGMLGIIGALVGVYVGSIL